jgi:uncharacterized damage-inducible protein DinB
MMVAMTRRADVFLDPADDPRENGPTLTDERATYAEYLRCQRLTLQIKCAGLDPEQLARRSVPPSTMSLLGLVRHLADVERGWTRRVLAGEDAPNRWRRPGEDVDFDGAVAEQAVVDEAWAIWHEEAANTDAFLAAASDMGQVSADGTISVREVMVHLVEEYARHNGHADLLRELIDGRVGQ